MSTLARLIGCFGVIVAAIAVSDSAPAQTPRRATVASAQTEGQPPATPTANPVLRAPGTDGTVVAAQPFQRTTTVTVAEQGQLWLVDLNPNVHSWMLLVRTRPGRSDSNYVHIENPTGRRQTVSLEREGLVVTEGETRVVCGYQTGDNRDLFGAMQQPMTPFCDNRLLVRAQQGGYRTTEEAAVSLLRSMGGVGESIINIYKTTIGQDANLERVGTQTGSGEGQSAADTSALPRAAAIAPADANRVFSNHRLGLNVARPASRMQMRPGQWYPAAAQPGVAVSIVAPRQLDPSIFQRYTDRVHSLDEVESEALVYLVAFDLAQYTLDYSVGTAHPGVEWSSRPQVSHGSTGGPDGYENLRPLARVGMVPPVDRSRLVGVFAGGFKRDHGAFRYGRLAQVNNGTHYGFIESGVVLSRLQPGLSTVIGRIDGSFEMRTWTEQDDATLDTIQFARQNGVPIVEADASGNTVPGATIRSWGLGNWSGALVISRDPNGGTQRSADLRTLRSGLCLQREGGRSHVIYAYFTAATPSAMARVFQAYNCAYAMMLDMNAPELTYAAVYGTGENGLRVEYVNTAMLDTEPSRGRYRFLTVNDNRDFFSVLRRRPAN